MHLGQTLPYEVLHLVIQESSLSTLLSWCLTSKRCLSLAGVELVRDVEVSCQEHVLPVLERLSPHRPPPPPLLLPLSFSQTTSLSLSSLPPFIAFDTFFIVHRHLGFVETLQTFKINVHEARKSNGGGGGQISEDAFRSFFVPRLLTLLDPDEFLEVDVGPSGELITTQITPHLLRIYNLALPHLRLWSIHNVIHETQETPPASTFDLSQLYLRTRAMARDRGLVLEGLEGLRASLDELGELGLGPVPSNVLEWLVVISLEFDTEFWVAEGCSWREMLALGEEWTAEKLKSLPDGARMIQDWARDSSELFVEG